MEKKRTFKIARKLTGTAASHYRPWKDWEIGDIVIGKYLSSKVDNYGKPGYSIEVEDAMFKDEKLSKELQGKILGLNSSGMLDKAMDQIEFGSFVQIEYQGVFSIEKGKFKGKEAHSVAVSVVVEDGAEEVEDYDL